jgi:pristinamycin I synthase-3/4
MPAFELSGLSVTSLEVEVETAKYDLSLTLAEEEAGPGLAGAMVYRTDLFSAPTIERLLMRFERLLREMVADPDRPVMEIDLSGDVEQGRVLSADTSLSGAGGPCLPELIAAQAARAPDRVALIQGSRQITYGVLNALANKLARWLRTAGIGPETRVGLCAERSIESVVGMLGIMKAGGAFVPLDPTLPQLRLAHIACEAGLTLILTQSTWREVAETLHPRAIIIDGDDAPWAGEIDADIEQLASPDNLAYVTYTSGSTGQPKGIASLHRGVANYLQFIVGRYGLTDDDVALQLAAPTFDASVRDTLGPLLVGARVVLPDTMQVRDPVALRRLIRYHHVTTLPSVVPTVLRALTDDAHNGWSAASVRLVLCSGEALFGTDCARARAAFGPRVQVVNQYGPTECTMTAGYYFVGGTDDRPGVQLVGSPIGNMRFYVLDRYLHPVPDGMVGEIYIGGIGLGRGYLHRPGLSAERFLPDPLTGRPGERMYRTGDRGRLLPSGDVEFLGRLDHQVKIRGQRIELSEIESVLRQHSGVREAVVVVQGETDQDRSLAAFVVPVQQSESDDIADELRGHLRTRLPAYMVPAYLSALDALPLTAHGKVDRLTLARRVRERRPTSRHVVAPANDVERAIAAIWREVLDVDHVGVHDNFFDLGGHSLLMARIHQRLSSTWDLPLSLLDLFTYPTIAALATYMTRSRSAETTTSQGAERAAMRREQMRRQPARCTPRVEPQRANDLWDD